MNGNTWFDAGEGPVPTELIGRYRLVGLADTGRNGTLFRAHDTVRGEAIAVRVVPRDLTGDADRRTHLVREVKRARRLSHPNVLSTHDLVVVPTESGADVLVTTEYVPGHSLARRIRERGALAIPEVLRIGRHLADALSVAHDEGVLHCDVNPEHVLLGNDGRILLTDFGLGRVLGAPLDPRTDVHGLGSVLYACLVGHTEGVPSDAELPPTVPGPLADIVRRCVAARPEDRPASMVEVERVLRSVRIPLGGPRFAIPPAPRSPDGARVAVFPIAAAPGLEHHAEAVADEIAETLATTGGIRVRRLRTDPETASGTYDVAVMGEIVADGPDVVVTLRLVVAPSGWRLWLGRFDVPATELLASAYRASEAIARALASPGQLDPVGPRPSGPSDPQALELYLRGVLEARRGGSGSFALLDGARARAPGDPRILAAVALARLRRAPSKELPLELVSAERFAREAIARAPTLAEAHLALVDVLRHTGNDAGAARAARRALALAPGSPAALAAIGALWMGAGDLDAAVAHLEQAWTLEPDALAVRVELARAWALLGRSDSLWGIGRTIDRCRFALWFPAGPRVLARDRSDARVDLLGALRRGRWVPESAWASLETTHCSPLVGGDRAVRAESAQLVVETRAFAGFTELALAQLERASGEGLLDPVWLDRCPLLHPLRGDPRFVRASRTARDRATGIVRALDGGSTLALGAVVVR